MKIVEHAMGEEIIKVPSAKIFRVVSEGDIKMYDLELTFEAIKYYTEVEKYNKALYDITQQESLPTFHSFQSINSFDVSSLYFAFLYSDQTKTLSRIKNLKEIKEKKLKFEFFKEELDAINWLEEQVEEDYIKRI